MTVTVHPTAIVDPGASLGADVVVGPFCRIGAEVELGDGARLVSHVVIEGRTRIGRNARIYPFAVLGMEPQDVKYRGEPTELIIGDNVLIREQVTFNRGTPGGGGVTRIGSNGLFLIGAHVAHDCTVGNHVIMSNHATLGGKVIVEDSVVFGGLAAVHQFVRIGRHAMIGGLAAVAQDVIPFGMVIGNHARLVGLNLVGLKRRGFSKDVINTLRNAFRTLFAGPGLLAERIARVEAEYQGEAEVMEIIRFIHGASRRSLCQLQKETRQI